MDVFLYLTKRQWAESWVNGGEIPISLASSYLSTVRSGTNTPDENLINDMNIDIQELRPLISVSEGGGFRNATFQGNFVKGRRLPDVHDGNYFHEDGLILSFSLRRSRELATRMGKEACVKIHDVDCLRRCIDEQLGQDGTMRACEYTDGPNRNHFLKSTADSWQQEVRIFWPSGSARSVVLPSGIAELVILE
jgi:hypothetical protein